MFSRGFSVVWIFLIKLLSCLACWLLSTQWYNFKVLRVCPILAANKCIYVNNLLCWTCKFPRWDFFFFFEVQVCLVSTFRVMQHPLVCTTCVFGMLSLLVRGNPWWHCMQEATERSPPAMCLQGPSVVCSLHVYRFLLVKTRQSGMFLQKSGFTYQL